METPLRSELTRIVGLILSAAPAKDLGFYLHGSQWSGSADERSDVDVLGLAADDLSDTEFKRLRSLAAEVALSSGHGLDLKIHRLEVFGQDQYVDLGRASEFLGGVDLRDRLPPRTFDDSCHELVSIACQILLGGTASEIGGPRGQEKDAAYLAAALLAARHGYVATGAHDAVRKLREIDPGLVAAFESLNAPNDPPFTELANATRDALLHPHAPLGPRCGATIDTSLRRE